MTPAANAILAAIRAAAEAGRRCPDNPALQDAVYAAKAKRWMEGLRELTAAGVIRITIAGNNWRQVEIPAEGLKTLAEPRGARVWLVVDEGGSRRVYG